MNIGSCFGKSKTPKVKAEAEIPNANVNLSSNINIPEAEVDAGIDAVVQPTIKTEMKKTDIKQKSSLSSCFGKPKAPKAAVEVEHSIPSASMSMSGDIQCAKFEMDARETVDLSSPSIDEKVKIPPSKGKMKLGSCLGKSKTKAPKVKVETDIPTGTIDLSSDTSDTEVKAGIDVDIVQPTIKCEIKKPDLKQKSTFGSCFGKPKVPKSSVEVEHAMPSASMSVSSDIQDPNVEIGVGKSIEIPSPLIETEVNKPLGKRKINFGSCLGKSKTPKVKVEADIPTASGDLSGDISHPDAEVDAGIDAEILQPTIKNQIKNPDLKQKTSFGSCFGKPKVPKSSGAVEHPMPSASLSVSSDIQGPNVEIEVGKSIELPSPSIDAKIEKPSGKDNMNFGSCFGKSKSHKVKVEADIPTADIKLSSDFDIPDAEVDVKQPSIKSEIKKSDSKHKSSLSSCFGKPKSPKAAVEIKPEITSPSLSVSGDIQDSEVKLEVGETIASNVKKPSGKGKIDLGSCLGKSKIKAHKVNAETNILTRPVDLSGDIDTPSAVFDKETEIPNLQISSHELNSGLRTDTNVPCLKMDLAAIPEMKEKDVDLDLPNVDFHSEVNSNCLGPEFEINKFSLSFPVDIDKNVSLVAPQISVDEKEVAGVEFDVANCEPNILIPSKNSIAFVEGQSDVSKVNFSLENLNAEHDLALQIADFNEKLELSLQPSMAAASTECPDINLNSEMSFISDKSNTSFEEPSLSAPVVLEKLDVILVNRSNLLPNIIPDADLTFSINPELQPPAIEVERDVKSISFEKLPDVKVQKVKSGISSCFGKSPKSSKADVYFPSLCVEKEAVIKVPEAANDIDVGFGDETLEITYVDPKIKLSKPSLKLGSFFGKPNYLPELENQPSSVEVSDEINIPEKELKTNDPEYLVNKYDIKITENTPKPKSLEVEGGLMVEIGEENSHDNKVKKVKNSATSCFGKSQKVTKEDVYLPSTKLEGNVDETLPNTESKLEINIKEPKILELQHEEMKIKPNKSKMKIGSCFGKTEAPTRIIQEADGFSNEKLSKIDEVEKKSEDISILHSDTNGKKTVKGKSNFGSFFGMSKPLIVSNAESNVEIEGNLPVPTISDDDGQNHDYKLNTPNYESKEISSFFGLPKSLQKPLGKSDIYEDDCQRFVEISSSFEEPNLHLEVTDVPQSTVSNTTLKEMTPLNCDIGSDINFSIQDLHNKQSIDISPYNINLSGGFIPSEEPDYVMINENLNNSLNLSPEFNFNIVSDDMLLPINEFDNFDDFDHHTYENVSTKNHKFSDDRNDPLAEGKNIEAAAVDDSNLPLNIDIFETIDNSFKPPEVPKRWYGIDNQGLEISLDSPKNFKNENENCAEAISDIQSLQFMKTMVHDSHEKLDDITDNDSSKSSTPVIGGKLGPFCLSAENSRLIPIETSSSFIPSQENSFDPVVKRTIRKDEEPNETIEEQEDTFSCAALDDPKVSQLLMDKLAEFNDESYTDHPMIKRTIKVKTYKINDDSGEPESVIEEYEDDSFGNGLEKLEATEIFKKKLAEVENLDLQCKPTIKRTVKIKTYKTIDGGENQEETIEEYEDDSMNINLEKSEATKLLLEKLADFNSELCTSEPVVKRTIKVKTYKTSGNNEEAEKIFEEQLTDDMSITEFLEEKYPHLKDIKSKLSETTSVFKQPGKCIITDQKEVHSDLTGEVKASLSIAPYSDPSEDLQTNKEDNEGSFFEPMISKEEGNRLRRNSSDSNAT